jgi:hypothetical protein
VFLERCRQILCEWDVAELDQSLMRAPPTVGLRVSLALVGILTMPAVSAFLDPYLLK